MEHLLFSWLKYVWPWINVSVKKHCNTWCILISQAVDHRCKFDDDDFNSFRGIASEGQTHRHRHGLVYVNLFKVFMTYKSKTIHKRDIASTNIAAPSSDTCLPWFQFSGTHFLARTLFARGDHAAYSIRHACERVFPGNNVKEIACRAPKWFIWLIERWSRIKYTPYSDASIIENSSVSLLALEQWAQAWPVALLQKDSFFLWPN